jgi:hypothetical protein
MECFSPSVIGGLFFVIHFIVLFQGRKRHGRRLQSHPCDRRRHRRGPCGPAAPALWTDASSPGNGCPSTNPALESRTATPKVAGF